MKNKWKKFKLFMNISWTDTVMVVIFYALFVSAVFSDELKADTSSSAVSGGNQNSGNKTGGSASTEEPAATGKELEALRKEMSEVLLKAEEQNKELLRLQLGLCSAAESPGSEPVREKDLQVYEALLKVRNVSKEVVSGIFDFCVFAEKMPGMEQIPETERIKFKYKLENLKATAEKLNILVNSPSSGGSVPLEYRILSVNDSLQIAVINAGTVYGVCPGMILRMADGNNMAVLKVAVSRPFISAAIATEGDLKDLAPGMRLKIESSK